MYNYNIVQYCVDTINGVMPLVDSLQGGRFGKMVVLRYRWQTDFGNCAKYPFRHVPRSIKLANLCFCETVSLSLLTCRVYRVL
jgi:hypothetical protein